VRVAALYDIHANLPALRAVLNEVEAAGIDLIVFGGDNAWGPLPRETMDLILTFEHSALFIRGNADREVAERSGVEDGLDPTTAAINRWAAAELTPSQRSFLGSLPDNAVVDVTGLGPVLFCHGSPRGDDETITTATTDDRLGEMLAGVDQRTIVCGHTHAQFERRLEDKTIVNAGSVGLPFGERGAYWALLGPVVSLRRTDYDYDAAAASIRSKNGPEAESFATHVLNPPPFETAADLWS
jgi:predicted phosphodiesterase